MFDVYVQPDSQSQTHTHLKGLKCRGSEWSRFGRGKNLGERPALESLSVKRDGFWERPCRAGEPVTQLPEGSRGGRLGGLEGILSFRP